MIKPLAIARHLKGFTLVEALISVFVVTLIATAVITAYSAGFKSMELSRAKIAAVALANEKMEEIRNMSYDDIATEHGVIYPPGNIKDNDVVTRKGIKFNVNIIITYVDDSFDGDAAGTIAGKPQDFYPYDYKKVEIRVSKEGRNGYLAQLTSNVAAKAAETESNSGIIKFCVIDATGAPVADADITLTNSNVDPPVDIAATTGTDGCIMVPNLPPDSHNHYHLTASKDGYSSDQTYPRTAQNPNEEFQDIDVLLQQVTSKTLTIDKKSNLVIDVVDTSGNPVPNGNLNIHSSKEIYFNPTTYSYDEDFTLDANGHLEVKNISFENYSITLDGWNIVSTSPYQPVQLDPNTTLNVKIVASSSSIYPSIYNAEPREGRVSETANITVTGDNFDSGAQIKLIKDGNEIVGTDIVVDHGDTIEAVFNLSSIVGSWDIVVENPGGDSVKQINGYEIKE